MLAAGVGLWSFFTFATPSAAQGGTATLLAARVLLGVGEGVAFPSIHSLISRWGGVCGVGWRGGPITHLSLGGRGVGGGGRCPLIHH